VRADVSKDSCSIAPGCPKGAAILFAGQRPRGGEPRSAALTLEMLIRILTATQTGAETPRSVGGRQSGAAPAA